MTGRGGRSDLLLRPVISLQKLTDVGGAGSLPPAWGSWKTLTGLWLGANDLEGDIFRLVFKAAQDCCICKFEGILLASGRSLLHQLGLRARAGVRSVCLCVCARVFVQWFHIVLRSEVAHFRV